MIDEALILSVFGPSGTRLSDNRWRFPPAISHAIMRASEDLPMVTFSVNGTTRMFDGDPDMPLLWYLRDEARLTGTRFGCGAGLCGACTVHLEGQAVRSCQTL